MDHAPRDAARGRERMVRLARARQRWLHPRAHAPSAPATRRRDAPARAAAGLARAPARRRVRRIPPRVLSAVLRRDVSGRQLLVAPPLVPRTPVRLLAAHAAAVPIPAATRGKPRARDAWPDR